MRLLKTIARGIGGAYTHVTTFPERVGYGLGYTSEIAKSIPGVAKSYSQTVVRNIGYTVGQNAAQGAVDKIKQPDVRENLR